MPIVTLAARSQARRRWRALVVLTLFAGLVAGLSISLIAGSRRSASVVRRYFDAVRPYTVDVAGFLPRREMLAIPNVVRADPQEYLGINALGAGGKQVAGVDGLVGDFAALDPTYQILSGRRPDLGDPSEAMVGQGFARQLGIRPGDDLAVRTFGSDQYAEVGAGSYNAKGPSYRFHIVGVVRTQSDIALDEPKQVGRDTVGAHELFVSYRFMDRHRGDFLQFGGAFGVQLRHGAADLPAFERTMRARLAELRRAEPKRSDLPESVAFEPPSSGERRQSLQTPVDLETGLLLGLGIGVGAAGVVVLALVLRAEQRVLDDDTDVLRQLGLTRGQFAAIAAARIAPVGGVGAAIAAATALALSSRYPIGIGREIELSPGFAVNVAVLAIGVVAVVAVPIALAALFGGTTRRAAEAAAARRRVSRWTGLTASPVELAIGTSLAFSARGTGRRVPTRQAIAGGACAVALVVGLVAVVAAVDHLSSTPAAHGWPWDAVIGNVNFPLPRDAVARLKTDPRLVHRSAASYGQATIDGRSIEVFAFDVDGSAPPAMESGRLPSSDSEIALGARLMTRLGVHTGGEVRFSVANGEYDANGTAKGNRVMTVVGVTVPPMMGEADFGQVGVVTLGAVTAAGGDATPKFFMTTLDHHDLPATLRSLDRDYGDILTDNVPARVANLHQVRSVPLVGALVAGLMGTLLLGYTLMVCVHTRTRELAIVRALGLRRRQGWRVIAWQSLVIAGATMLIGIPIGVLGGAVAWRAFAHALGVGASLPVPHSLALLLPAALLVALVGARAAAHRLRHESLATLLHVE